MTYSKALHTEQHGERIVVVRKDNETGEYRCRLSTYGVSKPEADYFTDDLDDAKRTAKAMATCKPSTTPAAPADAVTELLAALQAIVDEAGPNFGRDDGLGSINRMSRIARLAIAKVKGA